MPDDADEKSSLASEEPIQPFLDCVAYLMAKRWLREQRQAEENPQSIERRSRADPPDL